MKTLRLIYIKFIYNLYKFFFQLLLKFLKYNFNRKIIFYLKKLFDLLILIYEELYYDYYLLKSNLFRYFSSYKKLGFFKHILFIFFFFAGLIPLLLSICIFFFFIKYIFKYIFLILDFLFFPDEYERNYYNIIKYNILEIFELIPIWFHKIYKFIFKSRWTLYFFNKFKYYLKNKRNKIFIYFITKIDYFIMVYIPAKIEIIQSYDYHEIYVDFMIFYYKTKRKIFRTIPWRIRNYIYIKYIKYIYNVFYIRIYKNIILRNYLRYILRNIYLIKIFFIKTSLKCSDWYHYFYYKYKHVQYYWIWLYKVYFRSYACVMTIEAFFLVNYKNGRAYFFYSFSHIYYVICYFIVSKIYEFLKLYFKRFYYLNCLIYYLRELKIKYKNEISNNKSYFNIYFVYYMLIWWIFIFWKTDLLFDWKEECYYFDFGDKSQTWWNIALYDVVQLFFARAYWSRHYFFKLKYFRIVYNVRFDWFYLNFSDRFINQIRHFFWKIYIWIKLRMIWCSEIPYKIKKYYGNKRYAFKIFYYIKFKGRILFQWKSFCDWIRNLINRIRSLINWIRSLIN